MINVFEKQFDDLAKKIKSWWRSSTTALKTYLKKTTLSDLPVSHKVSYREYQDYTFVMGLAPHFASAISKKVAKYCYTVFRGIPAFSQTCLRKSSRFLLF